MEQSDLSIIQELNQNPMKILLKENVWRLIIQIINKKLFSFEESKLDEYNKEISSLLFFRNEVSGGIFSTLADQQNNITLGTLDAFYTMLISNEQSEINQENEPQINGSLAFRLLGGVINSSSSISRENFQRELENQITLLGMYFEQSNVIVSFIKRSSPSKQRLNFAEDQLLQKYLKIMGEFKQTNLKNFMLKLCSEIFGSEATNSIDQSRFITKAKAYKSRIVFTLLDIMKIELQLIHSQEYFKVLMNPQYPINLQQEGQNYYLKTIDKLLNKCIFNGDDKCDCKKCQCIRRNRNSAKESQKKKREALEQIGPLIEKSDYQVKKLQELESENILLRNILQQMVSQGFKNQSVEEIFQPISKIISYQLKEEEDKPQDSDNIEPIQGSLPYKKICKNNVQLSSSSLGPTSEE